MVDFFLPRFGLITLGLLDFREPMNHFIILVINYDLYNLLYILLSYPIPRN